MAEWLGFAVWLYWLLLKVLQHLLQLRKRWGRKETLLGQDLQGTQGERLCTILPANTHTCWPCVDWKSWATAAKASEFCSWAADGAMELAVTAVTGSLAKGGGEPGGDTLGGLSVCAARLVKVAWSNLPCPSVATKGPPPLLEPAAMSKSGWITSILKTPFFCHKFKTRTILLWKVKKKEFILCFYTTTQQQSN